LKCQREREECDCAEGPFHLDQLKKLCGRFYIVQVDF
jgi:hypothetical protein